MSEKIFVVLIGLIGGISVGIQSPIAGAFGQRLGGTAGSEENNSMVAHNRRCPA